MSLRSGKQYQPSSQNESVEKQQEATQSADACAKSVRSRASRQSSGASTASSSAMKARAKAEAARAELSFAEEEARIIKQKADLEANLHILKSQKAVAAATAEAAAYEEDDKSIKSEINPEVLELPISSVQRTSEYVRRHSRAHSEEFPLKDDPLVYQKVARAQCEMDMKDTDTHHYEKNRDVESRKAYVKQPQQKEEVYNKPYYSETAREPFHPQKKPLSESQGVQDVTKYLIRREMLNAGLLKFDDRPENYWAWKESFQSAIQDLNLSSREELDLMIKWLGEESAEQAKRIRSVHVFNPTAALNLVWQRLEECYGSSEAVEHALLKKLEYFPKLTNKDNVRLRELGDILQEIECAKEGGYLPGLSYTA